MDTFKKAQLERRRQRRGITVIMVIMMGLGLVVTLYLLRDHELRTPGERTVVFDPDKCVRLQTVSKVYVIRVNPVDTTEVWFGTEEGIRVLETETATWIRYGMDHGLRDETIADIAFAGDTAWVATWNGLASFDRAAGRFHAFERIHGLGGARIVSLECVPGHGVYFYLDGKGIHHLAPGDSVPQRVTIPGLANTARVTCLELHGDELLVGAEAGRLIRYRPADGASSEAVFERERSPKAFVWDVVRHAGRYFVATSNEGAWTAETLDDTLRFVDDFPAKGAYVFEEEETGLWCGTPFGLFRYDDRADVWVHFRHPDEREPTDFQVFSLALTGDELWYGSMDLGAGFVNRRNIAWQHLRAGLSDANIAALAATEDVLWVGFGYQGAYVDRIDAATMQFGRSYNSRDSIYDSHIQHFMAEGSRVYYGGYRSFGFLDLDLDAAVRRKFFEADSTMPFGDITDIVRLDSARLALAGLFGVVVYEGDTDSFSVLPGIPETRITCLFLDGTTLWLGTLANGVYSCGLDDRKVRDVGMSSRDRIVGITALNDSTLLVAVKRAGCFALDTRTLKFSTLKIPDKLYAPGGGAYERDIMAMAVIDGRVWLGTRESGCIVRDTSGDWFSVNYYNGLPSDEVRSFAESPAYVFVGCYGGICRYDKSYLEQEFFSVGDEG